MHSFWAAIDNLMYVLVPLAAFLILFLILRALVLWYWRIDRIVSLLEDIKARLPAQLPSPPDRDALKVEEKPDDRIGD